MRLEPGTVVEWESQAGGCWTTKRGVVIAYVAAGEDAIDALHDAGYAGRLMGGRVSKVDRYLVHVRVGRTAVRYYTPRADVLERAVRRGGTKRAHEVAE